MYASAHAKRCVIDYGALLRASQRSSSTAAAVTTTTNSSGIVHPPPLPALAEMRQVAELTSTDLANHLAWLLAASPLAAGLSGEADEEDEDEAEHPDTTTTTAKWRRLVRAGLPPSTPVCSIHCTDPVLILRTLAHWCVPWRATPAPFLDLLFVVPGSSSSHSHVDVSTPLRAALHRGELTDLCVRDAAERVVHARATWHATMSAMAKYGRRGLGGYLRISYDLDHRERASSDYRRDLVCPISRFLLTTALHELHVILAVAADDARYAHGHLVDESIDLLEYLLQTRCSAPVRVKPPAYILERIVEYATKVQLDDREAEEQGWFRPGGLRSARLLARLLCANTRSESNKFGDARTCGMLDGSCAPEIVHWCSNLLAPRFHAMHAESPRDENEWIMDVGRMRCARSVLVRAAMDVGAADLAIQCASNGGCGGRLPRTITKTSLPHTREAWVTSSRLTVPPILLYGWEFFLHGASAEHFGEKLVYRLVRAALVSLQHGRQPATTWFVRAILLYPATLELVLQTLLCPPPPPNSAVEAARWELEEQTDNSACVARYAIQDANMAQTVVARVLQSYAAAPEAYARSQVLVLLRFFVHAPQHGQRCFPGPFWHTHLADVLRATRTADTELMETLASLAEGTGTAHAFRAAAVFDCTDDAERDAAMARVLVWAATGTDDVVEVADVLWRATNNNTYLQSVQRARRLGCPWGPEAGWYGSDDATRMQQLQELNTWIMAEHGTYSLALIKRSKKNDRFAFFNRLITKNTPKQEMRPKPAHSPLPLAPVLPVPLQTFTIEEALQAWEECDRLSIVSDHDKIVAARQLFQQQQQQQSHNEFCSDEGARAALDMANRLLQYSHRNMARYFYHQVAQYCLHAAPSRFNARSQVDAMVQIAKMISVDRRSGAATTEDIASAMVILEWASPLNEEARLWLEYTRSLEVA